MTEEYFSIVQESSQSIDLTGMIINDDNPRVIVNYTEITGNKPVEFNNWAGIWKVNEDRFPWGTDPIASAPALSDESNQIIIPLVTFSYGIYLVGYFTGTSNTALSSTMYFPGGYTPKDQFSSYISLNEVKSDSISIWYKTPYGNDPKVNQNWVAVWNEADFSFKGDWIKREFIDSSDCEGNIKLYVNLKSGNSYTVAYGNNEYDSNISTAINFNFK